MGEAPDPLLVPDQITFHQLHWKTPSLRAARIWTYTQKLLTIHENRPALAPLPVPSMVPTSAVTDLLPLTEALSREGYAAFSSNPGREEGWDFVPLKMGKIEGDNEAKPWGYWSCLV